MKHKTKRRYLGTVFNYLKWGTDSNFQLPEIIYDSKSPGAIECIFNWESLGTPITKSSEPQLLAKIIQCKKSRDWHITEYREGISRLEFFAWEFVGIGDITIDNCIEILLTNNKLQEYIPDWGNSSPLYKRIQQSNINKEDYLLLYNLIHHPGINIWKWDPYEYLYIFKDKPEYLELIHEQIDRLQSHLDYIQSEIDRIKDKYAI